MTSQSEAKPPQAQRLDQKSSCQSRAQNPGAAGAAACSGAGPTCSATTRRRRASSLGPTARCRANNSSRGVFIVVDEFAERFLGVMEAGLDRAEFRAGDGGDFGQGEVLDEMEEEHGAVLG